MNANFVRYITPMFATYFFTSISFISSFDGVALSILKNPAENSASFTSSGEEGWVSLHHKWGNAPKLPPS